MCVASVAGGCVGRRGAPAGTVWWGGCEGDREDSEGEGEGSRNGENGRGGNRVAEDPIGEGYEHED